MLRPSLCLKYYSNPEFIDFFLEFSKQREVVPKFFNSFGQRPQVFNYKDDLLSVVRKGATSFHFSVERWINPMALRSDFKRSDLDSLRAGWDLILDIDCPVFEYSKICARLLVDALKFHGIKNPSIKYSGNKGFHIGVSFESFPDKISGRIIKDYFPEAARIINSYLSEMIEDYLSEMILELDSIKRISEKTGLSEKDLAPEGKFLPYRILDIDSIAISSRHLIRFPYSLHESSGLVSVPIKPSDLESFEKESAKSENVSFELGFLDTKENASELFTQAFDWYEKEVKRNEDFQKSEITAPKSAVSKAHFPPCIANILNGLSDGRKRSLFILINFFRCTGYDFNSITSLIYKWNKRNEEPLREGYIKSQLAWFKSQKNMLPPNCSNPNFYRDIGVCNPDNFCKRIKNPVTYALFKNKNIKKP